MEFFENENNMSDEEYVSQVAKLYDKVMKLRKDEDYEVNMKQMDKFLEIVSFFSKTAVTNDAELVPIELSPKELHGGLTAKFVVFHLFSDDIPEFCKALKGASAFTIETDLDNKVCISVTVPDVYVKKQS